MNQAHLHLFLVHLPVAGLLLILPVFFYALIRKDFKILKLSLLLLFVISLTGVAAFLTGEGAEEIIEHYPSVSEDQIHHHEESAEWTFRILIATGFLSILLLGMKFMPEGKNRFYYYLLSLLLLISVVSTLRTAQEGALIRHQQEIKHNDAIAAPVANDKD